jgi:hypothetical protein
MHHRGESNGDGFAPVLPAVGARSSCAASLTPTPHLVNRRGLGHQQWQTSPNPACTIQWHVNLLPLESTAGSSVAPATKEHREPSWCLTFWRNSAGPNDGLQAGGGEGIFIFVVCQASPAMPKPRAELACAALDSPPPSIGHSCLTWPKDRALQVVAGVPEVLSRAVLTGAVMEC